MKKDKDTLLARLSEHERGLEHPAHPTLYEQAAQQLDNANRRSIEISEEQLGVQKELEQIVKSFSTLPLGELDKTAERFILLSYKKDILTDMSFSAQKEVERLAKEVAERKVKEYAKQNSVSEKKRQRLNELRYMLGDVDIRFDKPYKEKVQKEIAQLEKELGGAGAGTVFVSS